LLENSGSSSVFLEQGIYLNPAKNEILIVMSVTVEGNNTGLVLHRRA
jgi:hypothetical protein